LALSESVPQLDEEGDSVSDRVYETSDENVPVMDSDLLCVRDTLNVSVVLFESPCVAVKDCVWEEVEVMSWEGVLVRVGVRVSVGSAVEERDAEYVDVNVLVRVSVALCEAVEVTDSEFVFASDRVPEMVGDDDAVIHEDRDGVIVGVRRDSERRLVRDLSLVAVTVGVNGDKLRVRVGESEAVRCSESVRDGSPDGVCDAERDPERYDVNDVVNVLEIVSCWVKLNVPVIDREGDVVGVGVPLSVEVRRIAESELDRLIVRVSVVDCPPVGDCVTDRLRCWDAVPDMVRE